MVEPKEYVTCPEKSFINVDVHIQEGYSRFGIKRSDYGYDQAVATLCLVQEDGQYYLGARDKSSDLCAYVREAVSDIDGSSSFDVATSGRFMRITWKR